MARATKSTKARTSSVEPLDSDAVTAKLNTIYAEEDSRLPPELEALSDEILEMAFSPGFPE
jgi:hypothetical protein